MILGQDSRRNMSVTIKFDGSKPELIISNPVSVCALSEALLEKSLLFEHLLPGCKPIVTLSQRFSEEDRVFIDQEVTLLSAEVLLSLVFHLGELKLLLSMIFSSITREDYFQTINQYMELDAYPLPHIDDMVNRLASYKVFSTFDLRNAYH